ncbi:protein disulfide-isomerase [Entamoeba marina]
MQILLTLIAICFAQENNNPKNIYSKKVNYLTKDTFDTFISSVDAVLVGYGVSTSEYSQKFAPLFDQLAEDLFDTIKLAALDCEESQELCDKHEISIHPSMVLFRKDRTPKKYEGEKNMEALKKWIEQSLRPSFTQIDENQLLELQQQQNPFILIRSKIDNPMNQKIFSSLENVDYVQTYLIESEDQMNVEVFNPSTKEMIPYPITSVDEFNESNFAEFVNFKTIPLFSPVSLPIFKRVEALDIYSLWYFHNTEITEETQHMFEKLAKEYSGKFLFFSFHKDISEDQVKHMRHSGNIYPTFSVIHKNKRNIYSFPEDIEITEENVKEFLDKIYSNTIQPHVKTSPSIKEEEQKDLHKINGNELEGFVKTKGKDSLIIFCVEEVESCKYFLETPLTNIAKRMKNIDTFQISWIDASTDDVPPEWDLDRIPKLILCSEKDGEFKQIVMEEMPGEQQTMNFLLENVVYKFEEPKSLGTEEPNSNKKRTLRYELKRYFKSKME